VAASGFDFGITLYDTANKSHRLVKTSVGGPERIAFEPAGTYLLAFNEWTTYGAVIDVKQAAQVLRFHPSELSPAHPHKTPVWWQGSLDGPHRILPFAD